MRYFIGRKLRKWNNNMLRTIVVATDGDWYYVGHPRYSGPFSMKKNEFKVGDLVYYIKGEKGWTKDNIIKVKGDK
jgi:hypothetical protein